MYNKNKRFMHSVLCTGKPKSYPMEEFVKKITTILSKENIRPHNYKISPKNTNVFIDFNKYCDMQTILKRKYNDFEECTIVITIPPKGQYNQESSVKIDGVPNYITHEELDDILSQNFGVYKVGRKFPSNLYPNTSCFIVDMKTKYDAGSIMQNLSEIDGNPVVVRSANSNSGNSSRNSDYSTYSSNSQMDQSPHKRRIPKNYKMIDSHSIMRSLTNLLILLPWNRSLII